MADLESLKLDEVFTRKLVRFQSMLNGRNRPISIFFVRAEAPMEFRCYYKKMKHIDDDDDDDEDAFDAIENGDLVWISGRKVKYGSQQILKVTEVSCYAITSSVFDNCVTKRDIPAIDCFAKENVLEMEPTNLLLHILDYLPPGT